MPVNRKYSKSSGFYLNSKSSFFDSNDALLQKSHTINSHYLGQPERLTCKLCDAKLEDRTDITSHGVRYVFCDGCGHLNGRHEDTKEFIEKLYIADSGTDYAVNYVDGEYTQRVRDIYAPKVGFLAENMGDRKFSVLDVGCGAGYFAAACIQKGIPVRGVDVGRSMIEFGNRHLRELGLADEDPLTCTSEDEFYEQMLGTDADVVSAIGVIEHLRQPDRFFDSFRKSNAGFLFYSVPMFSVSVVLENVFPDIFPRQLSGGHTHLFTEGSISKMNDMLGAAPVAEWRFGTDMMDFFRSTSVILKKNGSSEKFMENYMSTLSGVIDGMQGVLDREHFCSEIHCLVAKK